LALLQLVGALLILVARWRVRRDRAAASRRHREAAGGGGLSDAPCRQRRAPAGPANMPPLRIVAHREGAETMYTYADARNCRCLYVGGAKAYAEYRQLAVSEEIARDMSAASMNAASMNWNVWGSWDPRWGPSAF